MIGKTSITIAHRISTIKDSDVIYVIEEGNLKEKGSYEELVKKKGFFYRLEKGDLKQWKNLYYFLLDFININIIINY